MVNCYLKFNRNCQEAIALYTKAFGASVNNLQHYGDMPTSTHFTLREADRHLVLLARLIIDDTEIMLMDSPEPVNSGDNMLVSVTRNDEETIRRAWEMLKQEGEVVIDLGPTGVANLHGVVRDKFGINWMLTALPPEE